MTLQDPPTPAAFPPIDGPFASVLAGDDVALAAIEDDEEVASMLLAQASDPACAALLASRPRPSLTDGGHPIRLCLHATARQVQYDDTSPDLSADYLEALDACLVRGNMLWADLCASLWSRWVLHQSEASTGWRFAQLVLQRHADIEAPPRMLAAFAMMAERAGQAAHASALWERALAHPFLVSSARTRWLVEFEWARNHLMMSGGQPIRGIVVLERVHAGLSSNAHGVGRMELIDATLELSFYLVLVGRPSDALAVVRRTRAQLVDFPEYEAWLRGVEALAYAVAGRADEAARALADAARAGADTSSLELAATLPASMLVGALRGDAALVERDLRRGRARLAERMPDIEQRTTWTLFAAIALLVAGRNDRALELAGELEELVDDAAATLPTHAALANLVVASASDNAPRIAAARAAVRDLGIELDDDAADPWALIPSRAPSEQSARVAASRPGRVRIEVLDGLKVLVDGEPIDPRRWNQRRKARVALAVLVASGGRLERGAFTEALWHGTAMSPSQAASRISTVLSVARTVIGGDAGDPAASQQPREGRAILARDSSVELLLAPGDSTDIAELRSLATEAAAVDPRDSAGFESLARAMRPFLAGSPFIGLGHEPIVVNWRQRLRDELVESALAVVRGWIGSTAGSRDGAEPAPELLELAHRMVEFDPLDEQVASCQVELLARAGRATEASIAFHRFRTALLREVGLTPSLDFVRRHAALVDAGS